jgi:alkylation response protein AidB-like acyl-CoA dehydrogenase
MDIVFNHHATMTNDYLRPLFAQIRTLAAASDHEGRFPEKEFELIKKSGLLQMPLTKDPLRYTPFQTQQLLDILKMMGETSLPVGRIYEGHVNALQLIGLFGNADQKQCYFSEVSENQSLFGVWNTQGIDGIKIKETESGKYVLEGAKTFCSGAQWIQYPLITGELIAKNAKGWQMCIVPTEKMKDVAVDSSFWQPLGMRESASFKIDFTGITIDQKDLIGPPDAYYQQPYFSGGAIRFAAVQLGAAQAILEETHRFLTEHKRTTDPFQKARIGEIAYLVETGNLWIKQAAAITDSWEFAADENAKLLGYVNMARTVMNELCLKTMQLAERSVGARGLLRPNALERIHRDLTIYLKQPAPDAALTAIGEYVLQKNNTDSLWN